MSERESRDVARSLSVVHHMDRDLQDAASLAAGLIERSGAGDGAPTLLVLVSSPDDAVALGEAVLALRQPAGRVLTPVTSVARGRRIIASGATAIATPPAILAGLIADSALDRSRLQALMLLWPEEILRDDGERALLESALAEIPRTAERIVLCANRTPEVIQFLERTMWRAREIDHRRTTVRSNVAVRAISAPASEHTRVVRSLLDAFDPESAVLFTVDEETAATAGATAALFGISALPVTEVPDRRFRLGVLFDGVPSADALSSVAATVDELVAVVRPRQLAALHGVAANVTPLTWTGSLASARLTMETLRDEIRAFVGSQGHTPWVPLVEPLLEGLDPVEIAAAAIALLDRERRKARRALQPPAPSAGPARATTEERTGSRSPERRRDEGRRPDRGPGQKRRRDDGRSSADVPRGPRRDSGERRDSRGGTDRGRRPDDIERTPRAAREGREWTERAERLRHSRRGPRDRSAE